MLVLHKRLRKMAFYYHSLAVVLLGGLLLGGCDGATDMLAPFQGERPLTLLAVTKSAQPDIQWVGGRVAAVGINRGDQPALDSTLIWLRTAAGNDISSAVSVGPDFDQETILQVGGLPLDSLPSGETYTVWLAEDAVFDGMMLDPFADTTRFVDTTFALNYLLNGRSGGDPDLDVTFRITRNETLLEDTFTITWTPAVPLRRLAIRQSTLGGFTDLVWHIVVPEGAPDSIVPPIRLGEAPEGIIEVQEWTGFEPASYVLWGATSDWDGDSFGLSTEGYVYYLIFSNNFE